MRFINKKSTPKQQVWVARISTVLLIVVTAIVALFIDSAKDAFNMVILMGAGTGALLILRWFWWRINAYCEIVAMFVSFSLTIILNKAISPDTAKTISEAFGGLDWNNCKILIGVALTTIAWVLTAYFGPKTDKKTLRDFVERVNPDGPGWKRVHEEAKAVGHELKPTHEADSLLFAIGYWVYSRTILALVLSSIASVCTVILFKVWGSHQTKKIARQKAKEKLK